MELENFNPQCDAKRSRCGLGEPAQQSDFERCVRKRPQDPNSPSRSTKLNQDRRNDNNRKNYFFKTLYMGKPQNFWE